MDQISSHTKKIKTKKKILQNSSVILFNLVLVCIKDRFSPHAISYEFRLVFLIPMLRQAL